MPEEVNIYPPSPQQAAETKENQRHPHVKNVKKKHAHLGLVLALNGLGVGGQRRK